MPLLDLLRPVLTFIFELVLLALGWGLDDLAGYLAHPVRVAVLGVVGFHLLYNLARLITAPRVQSYRLEHIGVYRLQLMAVETVYVLGPFSDRRALSVMAEPVREWGLALLVLGTLLMMVANLQRPAVLHPAILAADSHGVTPQTMMDGGRTGVRAFQRGLFRWLRYPHMLGQLVLLAGLALCFRSWTALALAGLLLAAGFQRAREMDRAYERYYGRVWAEYAGQTRRFLPFLY